MAERSLPLFTYDPDMLLRLCTLFQEIWAAHERNIGSTLGVEEMKELKNRVAARLLRETEVGDFDPARIKERALVGL